MVYPRDVAPLVGAWIEIISAPTAFDESVSSLPSWERGLKSYYQVPPEVKSASLPSWERGLKYVDRLLPTN